MKITSISFMDSISVAIIGMLVVFAGLILLIVIIPGLKLMGSKKEAPMESLPVLQEALPEAGEDESLNNQDALVAAISAALAAVMDKPQSDFIVRRIRRV